MNMMGITPRMAATMFVSRSALIDRSRLALKGQQFIQPRATPRGAVVVNRFSAQRPNRPPCSPENCWPVGPKITKTVPTSHRALPWAGRTRGLRPRRVAAIVIAGLLTACGCGGHAKPDYPTVKLAGTVKVDGVVVEEGRIRFSPTKPDQADAAEGVVSAGRYTVDKAPIGSVLATFTGVRKTGRVVELYGKKSEETVNVIPAKYSRGLPVTVDAGGNRDFDLNSK